MRIDENIGMWNVWLQNEEYQATVGVGEPVTEQARVMLKKIGLKKKILFLSIQKGNDL